MNNWNYLDNIITCNIVYPIIILKKNNVSIGELKYNKYISKSIIYIHNCKLLKNNNLNYETLLFLYKMIENYYNSNKDILIFNKILMYIRYHKISISIAEKFMKFYCKTFNKTKIKIFYSL